MLAAEELEEQKEEFEYLLVLFHTNAFDQQNQGVQQHFELAAGGELQPF